MTPGADRVIAPIVWAAAFAFLWSFDPLSRPLVLDPATWDYMSVALGDGVIPYRDIFLHKTPGAIFVGALGARVATWVGAAPVAGAHLANIVMAAAGPALLYLLCRRRMTVLPALAAAAFMLAADQWAVAAVEGVRPKVATTVFGLGALLAATHGRAVVAGLLGAAATLCWQPGVAFLAGACWELRAGGVRALARSAAGAALPVLALGAWLASVGALGDFVDQAIVFNGHYIRIHARTPVDTVAHLVAQLVSWNRVEMILLPLAVAGLVRDCSRLGGGLAVTALVYLALVFVSFQAWPDTILFAPLLAAVLVAGLPALARGMMPERFAHVVVLAIALAAVATPHSKRLRPPIDFATQAAAFDALAAGVADDADVLVISLPEFLVHTDRHSRWTWPYMWFGVDRHASARSEGGFEGLLSELDAEPPALMLVARRWRGPLRQQFEAWARSRYTREQVWIYPHTVRPINVYRPIEAESRNYP